MSFPLLHALHTFQIHLCAPLSEPSHNYDTLLRHSFQRLLPTPFSPLPHFSSSTIPQIVNTLLAEGADVDALNSKGERREKTKIISMLFFLSFFFSLPFPFLLFTCRACRLRCWRLDRWCRSERTVPSSCRRACRSSPFVDP